MQHFSINFFSLKELNGVCDIGYTENNGDVILGIYKHFWFFYHRATVDFFTKRTTIQQRDGREIKLIYRKIKKSNPRNSAIKQKVQIPRIRRIFYILSVCEMDSKMKYELEKGLSKLNKVDFLDKAPDFKIKYGKTFI